MDEFDSWSYSYLHSPTQSLGHWPIIKSWRENLYWIYPKIIPRFFSIPSGLWVFLLTLVDDLFLKRIPKLRTFTLRYSNPHSSNVGNKNTLTVSKLKNNKSEPWFLILWNYFFKKLFKNSINYHEELIRLYNWAFY